LKSYKIITCKKIGIRPTLDLEINSPEHIFYANGIATSNSHAVSYAILGYLTAYCKAHFPKQFFTSYLYHAQDKQDPHYEINRLVNNARSLNITVKSPSLLECNKHFKLLENGDILFGVSDIKGIGQSAFKRIQDFYTKIGRESISCMKWGELLLKMDKDLPSPSILALINSGALDFLGIPRTRMAYEYKTLEKLTDKEREKLRVPPPNDILLLLMELNQTKPGRSGFASNKNRKEVVDGLIQTLQNPPYALIDSPEWLVSKEKSLLGTPLTVSNLDTCDTSSANCTCLDLVEDKMPEMPIIAAQIENVKEVEIKNGKNRGDKMAFLKISDQYCEAEDIVIFADTWREAKNIVIEGNTVLLLGKKDKKKGSLIINKVYQL
jgi:DNA polymerase-3 subunit alpha